MDKSSVSELVEELEMEINNGGFDQYFFNSAGDRVYPTVEALEAIGAKHTANIVRRAIAKFPQGVVPENREARQEVLLDKVSPDSDAFEEEDSAFLKYQDDLASLLATHANG